MSPTDRVRDFTAWLRAQPDGVIARLLRARPDLLHPVPSDVGVLAIRASGRVSTELALDRLDLGSLQVLEALALAPDPTCADDLAALLGVDPASLARPLERLQEAALVWGDEEVHLLAVVRELVPFPAGLGPPARLALAEIPPARLPALAADVAALLGERLGLPERPSAAEALDSLARAFEEPSRLAAMLAATPEKAREVIELLAAGPPVGRTGGARRPVDAATADTPLRWLLAHGLLVAVDDYTVVLPREIGLAVRGGVVMPELQLQPPPLGGGSVSPSTIDATAAGQAFTSVRLVESLLEAWSVDPPGVLRAGGLGVRELRRAARELDVDEPTAALLIEVAHAAGLIAPDDTGETWLPTGGPTGYDHWLAKSISARWCALASAWLTTTRVPGLVGRRNRPRSTGDPAEPAYRPASAPNALGPDVDRALAPLVRRDVLALLAEAAPEAGVEAGPAAGSRVAPDGDALDAAVRWRSPRRGGQLRDDLATWSRQEAEVLGITGRGALSSFGRLLVDGVLGDRDDSGGGPRGSSDGGPDGGSDGDQARRAVDALEPLLPQPLDHVLLQADLTAVAPGPLDSELSRELSLVADVESTGGATVYRFSPESIRRALDAGRSAPDLHALLAARSRTPVPQPLSYLIDDVARKHGRMRVGAAGCYLRCDDEAVLAEVVANRRLESLRLHRVAPTVVVSPLAPERVVERLRETGYAPAAESPGGAVLLRRPDARRAPSRPRVPRLRIETGPPSSSVVAVAVRAIRGGDRAATASLGALVHAAPGGSDALPHSASGETVALLREAVATGSPLWIGYLNAQGQASNRVIEPLRLAGGYLTAFDHRRDEVRTFAVHRITGVARIDEAADDDGAVGPDADVADSGDIAADVDDAADADIAADVDDAI